MKTIKLITHSLENIFGSLFNSNMDVMTGEARKIFSNEEDKKKYVEAVEKLKILKANKKPSHFLQMKPSH
jgi:hypothetical protein